ncbi:MAG: cupredoxin domain-containing protein [Actinobacteria bacterium]|nr:cupredoxin domain-containing protein [Actinomycetota bacterium]
MGVRRWHAGIRLLVPWSVVVALASCGGATEKGPGDPAPCEPEGTALSIVAEDTVFDRDCMAVRAGQPFTIELRSEDTQEHNVAIFREGEETPAGLIFRGETFRGPQTLVYEVPAIAEAGTYVFRCDVHLSTMRGTFVVA